MALPFGPRKLLGQHFLVDRNVAARIVAMLSAPSDAPIVEIGPGTGALTGLLLQRFKHVTAVEIDARAVAHLRTLYGERLRVVQGDVLDLDWVAFSADKGSPLYVIGNLPYNITSPILFALLRHRHLLCQAVLMMQREVAHRLVARPGTKAYGIPSVLTQLYASVELLRKVSPSVFVPRPEVESAVVRLEFGKAVPVGVDHALLQAVVRSAFGQRRKVLRNSLRVWTRDRGIALPYSWESLRAEELSPQDFVTLARHISLGESIV